MQQENYIEQDDMKKNVLITGATRGLGLSMSIVLANAGYNVIATGRKISEGLRLAMEDSPENMHFYAFDFCHLDQIQGFVRQITKNHGHLYGLLNNAALGHDGILATMHDTDIEQLIRVNVQAPILLTKYASRSMLIERQGRIINISSIIASTGFNGLSVYGATKASMVGFTKSLARELSKAYITVNAIAPGYMATDMTQALQDNKLDAIIRRSPMKKLVEPIDVAHGALYLLSDEAKMVTGITLTVDAGSTA